MWGWGPERWAVSCSPSGYGERGRGRAERGCWESNVGAECCEAWTSSHSLALELLSQLPSQSPRLRSFKSLICHGLEPPAPWPWVMGSDPARVPCTLETSLPHFGESILLHPNPRTDVPLLYKRPFIPGTGDTCQKGLQLYYPKFLCGRLLPQDLRT